MIAKPKREKHSRAASAPSGVQVDLVEVRGRFALNHPDVAHF
jgi:hypothetical protein